MNPEDVHGIISLHEFNRQYAEERDRHLREHGMDDDGVRQLVDAEAGRELAEDVNAAGRVTFDAARLGEKVSQRVIKQLRKTVKDLQERAQARKAEADFSPEDAVQAMKDHQARLRTKQRHANVDTEEPEVRVTYPWQRAKSYQLQAQPRKVVDKGKAASAARRKGSK